MPKYRVTVSNVTAYGIIEAESEEQAIEKAHVEGCENWDYGFETVTTDDIEAVELAAESK
jgi:hypothetical protein